MACSRLVSVGRCLLMAFGFTSGGIVMTPLRQRMTEDMPLRGLAPATQQAYLRYVEQLAVFTGKSPDLGTGGWDDALERLVGGVIRHARAILGEKERRMCA